MVCFRVCEVEDGEGVRLAVVRGGEIRRKRR